MINTWTYAPNLADRRGGSKWAQYPLPICKVTKNKSFGVHTQPPVYVFLTTRFICPHLHEA